MVLRGQAPAAGAKLHATDTAMAKDLKPRPSPAKAYAKAAAGPNEDANLQRRNALVLENLPLVKYVANRIASRLPSHVELDDLIDAGIIGLMDAIDKFEPARKIKFKTYAEFRIKGAILDELQALDWMPRSARQKATRLEKAYAELEQRLGRPAADNEVMEFLGVGDEEFQNLLVEARGISLISIDELRAEGDESVERNLLECLADPEGLSPAESLHLDQIYTIVAEAIDRLPEKEKLAVSLYYYDEMTMKEIGQIMNITESRVSQIHTKAILRLRARLLSVLEI